MLGVNLGKLGFLAEVDVPDLPGALSAIDNNDFTIEPGSRWTPSSASRSSTAFNDVAVVRIPGEGSAVVAVRVADYPFVSYAADAVVVATPTGSTAYSFSAGGPIVSPSVEALLVTPAAPHSAYNRGLVLSVHDSLALDILPASGRLAVEVDGAVAAHVTSGDRIDLLPRAGAARRRAARPHDLLPARAAQATGDRLRGDRREPARHAPAATSRDRGGPCIAVHRRREQPSAT